MWGIVGFISSFVVILLVMLIFILGPSSRLLFIMPDLASESV
jgi:hypothetical protein